MPTTTKIKAITVAEADRVDAAAGRQAGERLPWIKATDLVHACPKSGGHWIVLRNGVCFKCGAVAVNS